MRALNLLKVVSHTDWGADTNTLLTLYRSVVRSKLDYGCIVYGSARKSYLDSLDRVQNAALRICLGAFRTSPISSLHIEANELPVALRREKLALQYALKLRANQNNPAFDVVFNPQYKQFFSNRPKAIPTLGIRLEPALSTTRINFKSVAPQRLSPTPPWQLQGALFDFTMRYLGKKSDTSPAYYKNMFGQIMEAYSGFIRIFTDGSKNGTVVSAAAVSELSTLSERLPDNSSVFSAELHAVRLALRIMKLLQHRQFLVLCDSLSILQALHNKKLENPLVVEILNTIHYLKSRGKNIIFFWLPSHVGIAGNTRADKAAKDAGTQQPCNLMVPHSDFKHMILSYVLSQWQQSWDLQVDNKLHRINPTVNATSMVSYPSRRDETVLHRVRIGHTHMTHAYLLKDEPPPECIPCQSPLTVEHILIYCTDFSLLRAKYYCVKSLCELFDTVPVFKILRFLKEIGLYNKL